ncbi:hypothetical protein [Streptomyces lavendulae]|uniref:hypothetical protein n=1 Tax=Streptomyces lavendulae TaxID=1914 RepID=UPI0034056ECA
MTPDEAADVMRQCTTEVQLHTVATRASDGRQVRIIGDYLNFGLTLFCTRNERLEGLTVDALIGPQVWVEGVAQAGRVPSEVERWMVERAQSRFPDDEDEIEYLGIGVPGSGSLGVFVNVQRYVDRLVTRPVIFAEHVWDDAQHILPQQAWSVY